MNKKLLFLLCLMGLSLIPIVFAGALGDVAEAFKEFDIMEAYFKAPMFFDTVLVFALFFALFNSPAFSTEKMPFFTTTLKVIITIALTIGFFSLRFTQPELFESGPLFAQMGLVALILGLVTAFVITFSLLENTPIKSKGERAFVAFFVVFLLFNVVSLKGIEVIGENYPQAEVWIKAASAIGLFAAIGIFAALFKKSTPAGTAAPPSPSNPFGTGLFDLARKGKGKLAEIKASTKEYFQIDSAIKELDANTQKLGAKFVSLDVSIATNIKNILLCKKSLHQVQQMLQSSPPPTNATELTAKGNQLLTYGQKAYNYLVTQLDDEAKNIGYLETQRKAEVQQMAKITPLIANAITKFNDPRFASNAEIAGIAGKIVTLESDRQRISTSYLAELQGISNAAANVKKNAEDFFNEVRTLSSGSISPRLQLLSDQLLTDSNTITGLYKEFVEKGNTLNKCDAAIGDEIRIGDEKIKALTP